MTHRIAILGASGYTGAELVRLIATHPGMRIVALSADRPFIALHFSSSFQPP